MFPATLTPGQRTWLLVLVGLWALLLFGGFVFGHLSADGQRRMPTWTRMASSATLVLAAWSWLAFSGGRAAPFPLLIAVGMTCGFLGDLFMARVIPLPQSVLGGIGAFGLGHIAYISGILLYANRQALAAPAPRWGAWLAWLLIGLAGWYLVVFAGQQHTVLHWAALPYALLLASTAGFATGLALQAPAFALLAAGAALFLSSDLLLAARLFNGVRFYLSDDLVWLTYGPAQMLIVSAVGTALARIM